MWQMTGLSLRSLEAMEMHPMTDAVSQGSAKAPLSWSICLQVRAGALGGKEMRCSEPCLIIFCLGKTLQRQCILALPWGKLRSGGGDCAMRTMGDCKSSGVG